MGLPVKKTIHSLEEYFELTEKETDCRYEYYFGEIIAMAGATLNHNYISGNAYAELKTKLKGRRCIPFNSETRLQVNDKLWVYPDVMVSCHEEDINACLFVRHPSLIIEVLSSSTQSLDYSIKKLNYFQIPDLQYYILIATDRIFVDVFERRENIWANRCYTEQDIIVPLPNLSLELTIADLYEWVKFA